MEARRETAGPAPPKTPVGADSISARFAARQGSAGGINPSPTNRGEHPTKREGHTPPGGRRAGCPHPAAPRAAANTRGRDKSLPYDQRRARGQPGNRRPCVITNLCRGRCSASSRNPAPPQTPAGQTAYHINHGPDHLFGPGRAWCGEKGWLAGGPVTNPPAAVFHGQKAAARDQRVPGGCRLSKKDASPPFAERLSCIVGRAISLAVPLQIKKTQNNVFFAKLAVRRA